MNIESVEHTLKLKDGRILAYHTFLPTTTTATEEERRNNDITTTKEEENKGQQNNDDGDMNPNEAAVERRQRHPVLYFHGFPGCGLEGGFACSKSVADSGGCLYAIDRPGMGKTSSPYISNTTTNNNEENDYNTEINNNSNCNDNLDTFIENVWELIDYENWTEFSIIGASGGGPYVLALLASYVRKSRRRIIEGGAESAVEDTTTSTNHDKTLLPRLRNACLVGAICPSFGSDGMMEQLKHAVTLVDTVSESKWSRFQLRAMAASMGGMFNYVVPYIPFDWMMTLNLKTNSELPTIDREWMSDESNARPFLQMAKSMAYQGGNPGIYDDALIVMKSNHPHEDILRQHYNNNNNNNSDDENDLPRVGIFQGSVDKNVPVSHGQYLHHSIFGQRSTLKLYDDLGHISLIAGNSDDYSKFATAVS